MATMNEVIERVDAVKPNVYPEESKWQWMATLDGVVSLEVLEQEDPVVYDLPADGDKELLIPAPFDDVYDLYVASMIDFYNKEYNHYNNTVLMFKERLDQYKAWYIRNNNPSKARNFRNVMG